MSAKGKGFKAVRGMFADGGEKMFRAVGTPSLGGVVGQAGRLNKVQLAKRGKRRVAMMGGAFLANGMLTGRSSGGNGAVRKKSTGGYA